VISASRQADQLQGSDRPRRAESASRGALSAGSALDVVPNALLWFVPLLDPLVQRFARTVLAAAVDSAEVAVVCAAGVDRVWDPDAGGTTGCSEGVSRSDTRPVLPRYSSQ
jgi:hypothetical protein